MAHTIQTLLRASNFITGIKARDHKAFEMVFRNYYAPLCDYARLLIKDEDEARDIVQKLFVQIWDNPEKFEAEQSLQGLLYTSVKNRCLNWMRHEKVKRTHKNETSVASHLHVAHQSHTTDLETAIQSAIQKLSDQTKKVFELSRLEGLKYQEIADQLGISIKTVEVHMGKALKHMRTELSDFLPVAIILFPILFK